MIEKQRVDWVDTVKFLGIFAIYFGHFGTLGGLGYSFVFEYHVPLFFAISGFFASREGVNNFGGFIRVKVKRLLVPYFLFCLINIVIITINSNNNDIGIIIGMVKQSLLGIRNNLYASALWFLPCLFVVSILYEALSRAIKNKYIMIAISLVMFVISERYLPHRPSINPQWFFNIDSALYYIIYYSIGAVAFPLFKDFDFKKLSIYKKTSVIIITFIVLILSAIIYLQKGDRIFVIFTNQILSLFYPIFKASLLIYLNIIAAMAISNFNILKNIGKNTLILCGNETVIKLIINNLFIMLGFEISLHTPFVTAMYTFFILVVAYFTIVPLEKRCFPKIFAKQSDDIIKKQRTKGRFSFTIR